jgi:DNA-3-methyladenine glycosylase I
MSNLEFVRCAWCSNDPIYQHYHDHEWGVPLHDERQLFEMLCLEGAQAGLSWITILRKRDNYRKAFYNFDPALLAQADAQDKARWLNDPGIVRNRLKVAAFVANAQAYLKLREAGLTLDQLLWGYVDGKPIVSRHLELRSYPTRTELSDRLSKDLSKRGFKFVGSTICYAFMQAVGMVDDHQAGCFKAG